MLLTIYCSGRSHVVLESADSNVGNCVESYNPRHSWLEYLRKFHPGTVPEAKEDDSYLTLSNALGLLAVGALAFSMNK